MAGVLALAAALAALNRYRLTRKWEQVAAQRRARLGPADDIRLGSGTRAVLILHGFGDTTQSVRGLADTLHERGWTVRVPMLPGHGGTLRDHARSGATEWIDAARQAYEALGAESSHVSLVGQSMGGALAVILAAGRAPDALVLLAPYLTLSQRGRRIARYHRLVSLFVPYLPSRSDSSIRDAEARRQSLGLGVTTPGLIHELATVVGQAWSAAPRVEAPTLVIHSRHDPRIADADALRGVQRLGGDPVLRWATNSGHVLTVDHDREWIAAEVADWIETHEPS